MPIVMNVAGILSLTDDDIIPVCRGTLEQVYEYKSGTSKAGKPYSFQDFKFTDETGSIKLKLWGRESVPKDAKGKVVQLSAVKGKNGWAGLLRKTNEYQGKKTAFIDATAAAEFVWYTDEITPEEQAAREAAPSNSIPPGMEPPAQNTYSGTATGAAMAAQGVPASHPVQKDPPGNGESERLVKAKAGMFQIVNCQLKAIEMWQGYGKEHLKVLEVDIDPIGLSTLINATVIQMERERWHLLFPARAMKLKGQKNHPDDPDWNV